MSKKCVLVVDDAAPVRGVTRAALEGAGFAVLEAADGLEGLQVFQDNDIAMVISDLNMPGMNGMDMIRQIVATPKGKDIPVFMLTTEAGGDYVQEAKDLGVLGWVVKPFVAAKLVAAVRSILG